MVTPVKFPPGRFKLVTRPNATGSLPTANTTGTLNNAMGGNGRRISASHYNRYIVANQIGDHLRQLIVLPCGKAKFVSDGLTFDKSGLSYTLAESFDEGRCLGT